MPPPRRSATLAKRHAQQKRARKPRSKPGRTPVWLWLVGGIAIGAVLAVALFFQDAPRGGGRDSDTATAKSTKKTKPEPVVRERDFQLEDLHDGSTADTPARTTTETVAMVPDAAPAPIKRPPPKAAPKPSARPAAPPKASPKTGPKTGPKTRPKPAAKAGKGSRYWLQAGAFRSESQADNLKARLILSGLPVRVVRAKVRGNTWYRVRIGPYRDKAGMNRAKAKLRRQKIEGAVIRERG